MKLFKDTQNKIHEIADGFEYLLPAGCVVATPEEAAAIRQAAIPPSTPEELAAAASRAKTATDLSTAKAYAKLTVWANMTPVQQQTWVAANVTNLVQAQDVLLTLGIAVGILWRERAGL